MITLPYQGVFDRVSGAYDREGKFQPKVVQSSLFFREENFGIGEIPFDLLIDESHSLEFDIAEHAVENGGSISDHVQERLRSVQVTGLFTNHPIGGVESGYVNYGTEAEDGSVTVNREVDSVEINGVQGKGNESLDLMLDSLKALARERKPVRLVTSLEVYEEMVIESLDYDRGPDDGESIKFTVKLREIRTAKVSTVRRDGVWNPPSPKTQSTEAGKKMAENNKAGKVTGVEIKNATNKIKESISGEVIGSFDVDSELVFEDVEV